MSKKRCLNCNVEQSGQVVGYSFDYELWYCSSRCADQPKNSAQLLLIRGLPGSGKSTLARSKSYRRQWPVHLESDMFHMRRMKYVYVPALAADAHLWCLNTTRVMLNSGCCVVVSNTFVTLDEIAPYMNLGFDVAIEEMKESYGSTHDVPDDVMEHMRKRWQELP